MTASLIPNGKQQFIDINGMPLVGGLVYMYVPATLIYKDTWKDAGQTSLNTNPIVLDSRGQAVIYGAGAYRQILKDSTGNTIWDQPTVGIGSGAGGVVTITNADSPYTMLASDNFILCDVSAGAISINLIAASNYNGYVTVKIKGTAANVVTLTPNGSDTIDGMTSYPMAFDNQAVSLLSDVISYWGVI